MRFLLILLIFITPIYRGFSQKLADEDKADYQLYLDYCKELVPDTVICYGHGEYHHKVVIKEDIIRPGLETIKAGTINYTFTKFTWYKCDCRDYKENDPSIPVIYIDLENSNPDTSIIIINTRKLPRLPKNSVRISKEKICQIPRRKPSIKDYYEIRKAFQYLAWKEINKSLIFNSY